jgi:sulfur relay (sulfurtransferase) complex TusBCD TusD component (DsrE family)
MKKELLGIMVAKYEHLEHIIGVVKAAQAAGHPVSLFLTDEAVRFTLHSAFLDLLQLPGVEVSCCEHSCKQAGLMEKTEGISYSSQFSNAAMLHDSARVLVF